MAGANGECRSRRSAGTGAGGGDLALSEELCLMQADMLGMGRDNYRRMCKVCPDPDLRLHALLHRVSSNRGYRPAPVQRARSPGCEVPAASDDAFVPGPHRDAHRCWRCDVRTANDGVGLCRPCHGALITQ